eukprot:1242733-Prymnesium_polylepis.1
MAIEHVMQKTHESAMIVCGHTIGASALCAWRSPVRDRRCPPQKRGERHSKTAGTPYRARNLLSVQPQHAVERLEDGEGALGGGLELLA